MAKTDCYTPQSDSTSQNPIALHQNPIALQLMIQQPLLIRRPLIQSGDRSTVGFDLEEIQDWLGLTAIALGQPDLQTRHRAS